MLCTFSKGTFLHVYVCVLLPNANNWPDNGGPVSPVANTSTRMADSWITQHTLAAGGR